MPSQANTLPQPAGHRSSSLLDGSTKAFPFLDAWRVIAALTVLVLHMQMQGFLPPEIPKLNRIGHLAVIVFFVISGYSVAFSAHQHLGQPQSFLIARCSRIYSIAVPAIIFALVLDQIAGIQNSPLYPVWQYSKWWIHFGVNTLFLGEHWALALQPFSIAPYWSLSYEFWFYALMAVLMMPASKARTVAVLAMLLFLGPRICLLLPCWLMGVWAFKRTNTPGPRPLRTLPWAGCFGSLLFLIVGGLHLASGFDNLLLDGSKQTDILLQQASGGILKLRESRYFLGDYVIAMLFTGALLMVVRTSNSAETSWPSLRAAVSWLAPHTFAIYLLHYTLLAFVTTKLPVAERQGLAIPVALGIVAICLALAMILAPTRRLWAGLFKGMLAYFPRAR
jgi:peptidoglycan/LPS O-acetylase OafA/YrhL